MAKESFSISELLTAIKEKEAPWTAAENDFTRLSDREQLLLLGYEPGPDEESLQQAEKTAFANQAAFEAALAAPQMAFAYPGSFDLRNVGGKNFITSVKNQGGCGSCVAFGVAATVEGTLRRRTNNPTLAVDYSEAHLFYCYAKSQGRTCANGWWPGKALDAFKDGGVVDEACFPYTAGDQACNLCSGWQARVTKIDGWHRITSASDMKDWISTKGPLVACYTVYQDFFAYRSGIYRHLTGNAVGGHCVCCVGYNDAQRYWICKNSWGPSFGESGYFRIAYGQCGIDNGMEAVDGIPEPLWIKGVRVNGLWANNHDRNGWAHIQNHGWRKISYANDNIFFDMLAQLAAAKAANRPINIRQEKSVIKEIYVF